MNKYLIINADDFGFTSETNKAVVELMKAQRITSTSLLCCAPHAEEAAVLAKENGFKVGVHLSLNSDFKEAPWKSLSGAKSLTDEGGNLLFDQKLLAKQAKSEDVDLECEAQIKFLKDRGVEIDHFDNHCGTMYGINMRLFFVNAFRLSKKYGVPFRFPKHYRFLNDFFKNGVPFYIKLAFKAVVATGKRMRATLIDDMASNPYQMKDIASYSELKNYYLKAVRNLREGVTEIFLHPSYHAPEIAKFTTEWQKREWELELLFSDEFFKAIKDEGIELIDYTKAKEILTKK